MKKASRQNPSRKKAPKKTAAKKSGRTTRRSDKRPRPAAGVAEGASSDTLAKVLAIIGSYGIVVPTPATIVGPAVPSMGQFTNDVNGVFGRSYVLGQLKSTWTVNQICVFLTESGGPD